MIVAREPEPILLKQLKPCHRYRVYIRQIQLLCERERFTCTLLNLPGSSCVDDPNRSPDSRSFLKTASTAVVGGKVNVRLRLPVGF